MITVYSGQNKTENFAGKKYRGIRLTILVAAAVVNTPLVAADFVAQNLIISAKLNRGSLNHQVVNSNLDALGPACTFDNAGWQFFDPGAGTNTMYKILVASGVAAKEQGLIVVDIPFGGVIDSSRGGSIEISINSTSGVYSAAVDTAVSNITADLIETSQNEFGLPQILTQVVQANEVSPSFSPANGVKRVVFVNRDKTNILTASSVISSVTIESGRQARTMNYQQLMSQRETVFGNVNSGDVRRQTFELLAAKGPMYMGVKVTPILNTTNVNASKNYFVAWRICPSVTSAAIGKQSTESQRIEQTNYVASSSI